MTPANRTSGSVSAPYVLDPGNRSLKARKAVLRNELRHRRKVIPLDLQDTTRWKVTNHLRTLLLDLSPKVVALYYPQQGEIDLRPLARELWAEGYSVALPRTTQRGHPLTFNIWPENAPLEPDALGIPTATGAEIIPSTIIVPMLGYNRRGYRLGYGGGYYDRTLKELPLPAQTIGVCYTELEIPDFPSEYQDVRLGYIVTGKEVIVCQ